MAAFEIIDRGSTPNDNTGDKQTKPPLVLLKMAGLDLTKPAAIESALELFNDTLRNPLKEANKLDLIIRRLAK